MEKQWEIVLESIPKRSGLHRRRQTYRQLLLWHRVQGEEQTTDLEEEENGPRDGDICPSVE
jgi:hypothetical protein